MVKRYCDMCGKEMEPSYYLTVKIDAFGIKKLNGQMRPKEICESCAVKVREFVLVARGEKE